MGKHLVIVGAGHAHLTVLKNLKEFTDSGHRVTVVSSSPRHYYSGMGPGLLAGIYRPQDVRFHIKKMAEDRGASFVQDFVTHLDPHQKALTLKSGDQINYDVVSCNTGSFVPSNNDRVSGNRIFTVKPIENLIKVRQIVQAGLGTRSPKLIVVGGGVIGATCAYYLSKSGYEVTVVDRGGFGRECSHGNCGLITPSHVLPLPQPGAIAKAMQ